MRKIMWILVSCSLICVGAYKWGGAKMEHAKVVAMESLYTEVSQLMLPYIHTYGKTGKEIVYADVERFFMPLVSEFRATQYEAVVKEEEELGQDAGDYPVVSRPTGGSVENSEAQNNTTENTGDVSSDSGEKPADDSITASGMPVATEKKVVINRVKLQEFDYLRQNFFQVDNTTTVSSELLNVESLLGKDMTIKKNVKGPQILIYHTHSQEGYKDSVPGDPSTSIVGVGDYLEQLLEQNYGIEVLHHKGVYDLPKRDNAYSQSLPNLEKILQENPSIEVVIDLHRDGIAEDRRLVTEVNGKPTAKLMFFNGLSRTTSQGNLTYLPNPNIADNLALSFQMQLTAAEYYPDLTRKIYLKGYRYNLHLCPKSILVEVGAQTNTLQEAKNAMEPLADILGKVLYNGIYR